MKTSNNNITHSSSLPSNSTLLVQAQVNEINNEENIISGKNVSINKTESEQCNGSLENNITVLDNTTAQNENSINTGMISGIEINLLNPNADYNSANDNTRASRNQKQQRYRNSSSPVRMASNIRNNSNDNQTNTSVLLSKNQRLILGILVLLLVDFIWVSSSELTEYIFRQQAYSKPFFSTYLKTSLFVLFLTGFVFWSPWQELYCKKNEHGRHYSLLRNDPESSQERNSDEPTTATITHSNTDDSDNDTDTSTGTNSSARLRRNSEQYYPPISPPTYIPLNGNTTEVEPYLSPPPSVTMAHHSNNTPAVNEQLIQAGEDENPTAINASLSITRSVHFREYAEVRTLSDLDSVYANYSRLSYSASVEIEERARRLANRLSLKDTAKLAATFSILWFLANYTYQLGLSKTEAGIVNVLSSSSSLFTLILAAIFPSIPSTDKLTLSKLVAVLFSITGVILVSASDFKLESNSGLPLGVVFSLASALFYSLYLVLLRRRVDHEDKLDILLFFGFVGIFNLILLWPGFLILHYSGVESFEWPNNQQWFYLVINGLIGTLFSEVLWLWGSFLTSSLLATLAISLTIPLSMLADAIIKHVKYTELFYIGSIPMLFSFFIVSYLAAYYSEQDPLFDIIIQAYKSVRFGNTASSSYTRVLVNDEDLSTGNSSINSVNDDEEDDEDDFNEEHDLLQDNNSRINV